MKGNYTEPNICKQSKPVETCQVAVHCPDQGWALVSCADQPAATMDTSELLLTICQWERLGGWLHFIPDTLTVSYSHNKILD